MLKRDFILFYTQFTNYLFLKYSKFNRDNKYGVVSIRNFDQLQMFLVSELLEKVMHANNRISPGADVLIPECINTQQFFKIITDIKIKINEQ